MLHKHLPGTKPSGPDEMYLWTEDRRPSAAVLVKLAPDSASGDSARFAWSDMQAFVEEQEYITSQQLIEDSTRRDEDGDANAVLDELLRCYVPLLVNESLHVRPSEASTVA